MKRKILIIPAILILIGCGKGGSDNPSPTPPPNGGTTTTPVPLSASLIFPDSNAVCTTGTIISATQSSITFTWNASSNTDSYSLTLKNLLTATSVTQNSTTAQLTLTLIRNTPYSWFVTSKSTKTSTTALSNVWKFYNSGPGAVTYSPFPADITSPTFGQSITATAGAINLTWKGSSPDNNITGYDIYLGTSATPPLLKSNVTDSFLNGVTVTGNTLYYWQVVTKDANGNSSDSGVYQFMVN